MSIVLVAFPSAPKVRPEVVEREKKFEEHIERRALGKIYIFPINLEMYVTILGYCFLEILKEEPGVEASRILQILNDEEIPDTPPGSVLGSKSIDFLK